MPAVCVLLRYASGRSVCSLYCLASSRFSMDKKGERGMKDARDEHQGTQLASDTSKKQGVVAPRFGLPSHSQEIARETPSRPYKLALPNHSSKLPRYSSKVSQDTSSRPYK